MNEFINDQKWPGPWYFEICKKGARGRIAAEKKKAAEAEAKKQAQNADNGVYNEAVERVYVCGVNDWHQEVKKVVLPEWLADELRVVNGSIIEVKLVIGLLKGEFIRLQPFKSAFSDVLQEAGDLRPLTKAFESFAVLNADSRITVHCDVKDKKTKQIQKNVPFQLHVLTEIKPVLSRGIVAINYGGEIKVFNYKLFRICINFFFYMFVCMYMLVLDSMWT